MSLPPDPCPLNPILSHLNPAQTEAVSWPIDKPLLIHAGAGSGKTRILTRRMAYLISQGVPGFQILGVTFTNKAAQEMKARVQKLVSQDVWISTFHSTCLRILRIDGAAIGLERNFAIYDDQDQLTLIKECLKELNITDKQVHPRGVSERIQRAKDLLTSPSKYAGESQGFYEEQVAKVYQLYENKLAKLKALDFGDLIMKTVTLFDQVPAVLQSWRERFRYVLIDEYQDTNHAQYRFVRLLADGHRQITAVGDPDQSIYAWRGADIKNIMSFEKDYPESGIIRMEQNYRSTEVILNAANALINHNEMRRPKELWTERAGGEKIDLFEAQDEKAEAEYVVNQVMSTCASGKRLADQVIFYRVHAQSRIIEDALRRSKVPYKIVGGVRFYDRREIKDVIAYLRVVAFPHDDVSLKRILNVPARGIGKKTVEMLEAVANENGISFDDVLKRVGEPPLSRALGPKVRKSIADFYKVLTSLRHLGRDASVFDVLEQVIEKTRYVAELEAEKTIESLSRIENIKEFFSVIEDWEEIAPQFKRGHTPFTNEPTKMDEVPEPTPVEAFLESITLMTDLDTMEDGTNVLTLMTLHTAKGLEFPVVYMVGLEEGIFPNVKSYMDDQEDLEEERRLCYVGITRAKDKLHISYARERLLYGSRQFNLPSRFLAELPQEIIKSQSNSSLINSYQDDLDEIIDDDIDETRRRILFD